MEIENVMVVLIVLGSLLLLVGFLYFFFIGPVSKTEPQIISLKEPIKMIGVSKRTALKTIFKDAVELQLARNCIPCHLSNPRQQVVSD